MNTQLIAKAIPTQKWGSNPSQQKFNRPKWSRMRMFIQYNKGAAKSAFYPSWDYRYSFPNGIKTKHKSELVGLDKLIEEQHRQLKRGITYRYINIFANVTNNLCTVTGNFDYHVCTIVNGQITWKDPLFWKKENPQMLDIQKMIEYKKNKIN